MRFKGTLALFIVLVILGGYVYFTEIRGREERQQQEEAASKVIQANPEEVTEITLIYPDRTITGVRTGGQEWEITTPPGLEADADAWEQLASSISNVRREDGFVENAEDLAPFGLENPSIKVVAKLKDRTIELSFGSENPKKVGKYAKLSDSNEVFLTALPWASAFDKTLSDLRNKKLLQFDVNAIDRIRIEEPANVLDLRRSGDDWQIESPIVTKAENSTVTSFMNSISLARGTFPETEVDAKNAGLDPPALRITLHDAKANTDRVLIMGKTGETNYARDLSSNSILSVENDIPELARRPVFEWRDKTIARVDTLNVDRLEMQRDSESLTLSKDGVDWKLADGRKLQSPKISEMLNVLEFERAKEIIDKPQPLAAYGLEKPRIEAVFKDDTMELARITFGADSKSPEGVYLKTGANPAVMVVSKDAFDKFNQKVEELIDTSPAPEPQK